jgi:hypothetical protein
MSAAPLIVEIISVFLAVLYLLHRYSNFKEQNKITLTATFIAWYFSFLIVILLPLDISLVKNTFGSIEQTNRKKTTQFTNFFFNK